MYQLIFFDLDGTLYDLDDVIESVYQNQVVFLSNYLKKPRSEIQKMFSKNHIFPYKSAHAASATVLFEKIGVDKEAWKDYRETHFDVDAIQTQKAVTNDLVERFSKLAKLVLLSSNTYHTVIMVLSRLQIHSSLFSYIIASDHRNSSGVFSKTREMEEMITRFGFEGSDVLSIGDRFQTDIQPVLMVGGDGILVDGPGSVKNVYDDLCDSNLRTRASVYKFYQQNKMNEL